MLPKALPFALATALALTFVTVHAGSWAVVTVEDLPEQFITGTPTTLNFSVRQHGRRLVPGLRPSITVTSGSQHLGFAVMAMEAPGYYTASLTLPHPGEWVVQISSGFGSSRVTLMPIKAVNGAASPASIPASQRGRQLFVAKGCNTCHYHGDIKSEPSAPVGADLTDKRYSDGLLAKILKDPSIVQPTGIWTMPNLNLREPEIRALVAFINQPRTRP